jgi:hypothetical protein
MRYVLQDVPTFLIEIALDSSFEAKADPAEIESWFIS